MLNDDGGGGGGMREPWDVMVFFVTDGALELGGTMGLVEVYPGIR